MSQAHLGQTAWNKGCTGPSGSDHPMFGKKHGPEAIAKIKEGRKRRRLDTADQREAARQRSLGENNTFFGRRHTAATKSLIATKNTGRPGPVHSLETRRAISLKNSGPKNHRYIDGKSKERASQRVREMDGVAYRDWRKKVFSRDDYTCQMCELRGVELHADHIKPWRTHPESRYDVSNGRTLCAPCHRTTDTFGARLDLKLRSSEY